uniref:Uncharacterized protein LOC105036450 isoform X2 n=1 Tax=Elaeis guineensis var. tenera TaxID=51953 RepID=A0A6I9QLI3_ELAGV|nr:uncharacterized protein LOC105036450 isoform X2 [Elaeis guineensis]
MQSMRPCLSTPSSHRFLSCSPSPFSSLSSLRPRRSHAFRPLSSLRETKKGTLRKASNVPQNLKFDNRKGRDDGSVSEDGEGELGGETAVKGTVLAGLLLGGVIGGFGTVGYVYKDQINAFLTQFSGFIEDSCNSSNPINYVGWTFIWKCHRDHHCFNEWDTVAFLIARYFARERILKFVEGNKRFLAIDKAIGENGFRVVTLLRLSPLLPFSLGNYLYGLTSVKFIPYVLGSWLGMLPGTWAYVSAGAFGRAIIQEESDVGLPGGNGQLVTFGLGLLFTAIAAAYVTRLAKDAVKDLE